MSYAAAIDGLFSLAAELHTSPGQPRRKFELAHMRTLMEALGNPQSSFPSVLVAGTNGKGSTSATLAAILRAAGYTTGLYTSPHLERVNERIQFNGEPIADSDLAFWYARVEQAATQLVREDKLPAQPSFFETMTAMAFLAFAARPVDIAVVEVGIGGRLDATNIIEQTVSVITDISLDHTEWLGSTIAAIAREKAGILRKDGIMVTLPQHPEANQALGESATALNVRGVNATEYMPARGPHQESFANHYSLHVLGQVVEIDSPLPGQHQQRNIALAIAAAVELATRHDYTISATDIESGIRNTQWPGRLERFSVEGRIEILLDVAHNPAGAWALRAALSALDRPGPLTLIFGCLRDKAVSELAQILFPLFDRVLLTPIDSPRAATMDEMLTAGRPTGAALEPMQDAIAALRRAEEITPSEGLIVATGSVYLIGKIRSHLI